MSVFIVFETVRSEQKGRITSRNSSWVTKFPPASLWSFTASTRFCIFSYANDASVCLEMKQRKWFSDLLAFQPPQNYHCKAVSFLQGVSRHLWLFTKQRVTATTLTIYGILKPNSENQNMPWVLETDQQSGVKYRDDSQSNRLNSYGEFPRLNITNNYLLLSIAFYKLFENFPQARWRIRACFLNCTKNTSHNLLQNYESSFTRYYYKLHLNDHKWSSTMDHYKKHIAGDNLCSINWTCTTFLTYQYFPLTISKRNLIISQKWIIHLSKIVFWTESTSCALQLKTDIMVYIYYLLTKYASRTVIY